MEKKTREALENRFPDNQVKQRKGSFGKPINYVDGQAVVARLNACFDADWSFAIVSYDALETGETLVHGRLTALGITKEAFGKSSPAVSRETGEVISMADAYKAAATDAIKKCATLLGVAAYLYSDDYREEDPPHRRSGVHGVNGLNGVHNPPAPNGDSVAHNNRDLNNNRLTQKQLSALWGMGRSLGLNADQIRQRSMSIFNVVPEQLTRADASTLIGEFSDELNGQRGAA
jgi:hypothetical protein